jgi:hypothetical protein
MVTGEGRWRPHARDGYRAVAVDVTGFWRPRLCDCQTTHYQPATGKPCLGSPWVSSRESVAMERLPLGGPASLITAKTAS